MQNAKVVAMKVCFTIFVKSFVHDVTTMSLVMRKPALSLRYANNIGANRSADLYNLIDLMPMIFTAQKVKWLYIQTVTRL